MKILIYHDSCAEIKTMKTDFYPSQLYLKTKIQQAQKLSNLFYTVINLFSKIICP